MGDKHKSETQKPVKNTLLSGASHGFPFESFQGSSMLIPVSQDSPSVLNDSAADQVDVSNVPVSDSVSQLLQGVCGTTLEDNVSKEEMKSSSIGQGYTEIFSSFFGGGSQSKAELKSATNTDPLLHSNGSADSSSHLPPVPVPNVQTFSPVLRVPAPPSVETSRNEAVPNPIGFVHSSASPFQLTQGHPWPPQQTQKTLPDSNSSESHTFQNVEFSPMVPTSQALNQSQQNQNYLGAGTKAGPESENRRFDSSIGFQSFGDSNSKTFSIGTIPKAQSSFDLPIRSTSEESLAKAPSFSNMAQPQVGSSSGPFLYQTRTGSVDSFKPIQPLSGVSSPPLASLNSGPLSSVPPTSSGVMSKNYRRDHHKRLTYAPVPGLTSNKVVSSSYLLPSENVSTYSTLSYPSLTPSTSKSSLSMSQPTMDLSTVSADLNALVNPSSTSASSLHNFFNNNYASSNSSSSETMITSVDAFSNSSTPSISSSSFSSQNLTVPGRPPGVPFHANANQSSNLSLSSPSTSLGVGSVPVHPPIMSTKEQISSSNHQGRTPSPSVIPPSLNNLANLYHSGIIYRPAYYHWFLKTEEKNGKDVWQPFSMTDSLALEQALNSENLTAQTVVPTDGGRYDVNITNRIRTAVYWEEKPKKVMRCSWFYKSTIESRLHPYDENTAYNLEEEYKKAVTTNTWNRRLDLPTGDYIIMYGPSSMALFQCTPQMPEGWDAEMDFTENTSHRPKIVKRGVLDDFEIEDGEPPKVDHLIFVVHGIGSVCDLKFRTIEEAGDLIRDNDSSSQLQCMIESVDGFREKSLQLLKSHFKTSTEQGIVNRVEILPVSWHGHLHGETTGVDKKLQTITLKSIPRLRHFTNDTLLDILFYTSPVYCEAIMQQVGNEINTLYSKFKSRNPNYNGGVSLVGHSLGSLILFDMLCHQKSISPRMDNIKEDSNSNVVSQEVHKTVSMGKGKPSLSRKVSYVTGTAGTGQPYIEYPQLSFQPLAFFAMGSPIGMFVTIRGIDSLGFDFTLPTCSRFFNIFHPFDPVAYRIEALINPELSEKSPVLIPHHKGRKRMHLELKETMARVGADLKQRIIDSVKSTWNTVNQLATFGRAEESLEQEVDKVIEKQLEREKTESSAQCLSESFEGEVNAGKVNMGRRVDYVLQEAPLESFNEYVSALISHVIYWDSEDTMLLILKEIYSSMGISPDNQMPGVPGGSDDAGLNLSNSAYTSVDITTKNFPVG